MKRSQKNLSKIVKKSDALVDKYMRCQLAGKKVNNINLEVVKHIAVREAAKEIKRLYDVDPKQKNHKTNS